MKSNHENELVAEAEVRELFRRRRPDAASFREAVAQRIADAERESAASSNEASSHAQVDEQAPHGWRRAAAVLPPELASILLSVGKGWSAALLLPVFVLASAVGAFAASARSITRSTRTAAPAAQRSSRAALNLELARHPRTRALALLHFGPLVIMALPLGLGRGYAVDLIVALVLLSMLVLTRAVRGLSAAGLLERGVVLRVAATVLGTLFLGYFTWSTSIQSLDVDARLGLQASAAASLLGTLALLVLYRRSAPVGVLATCLFFGLALLALFIVPGFTTRSSPDAVRRYVESERLDVNDLRAWSQVSDSVEALAAVGAPLPDLPAVREQVVQAIESGADAHPRVWTAAARMKLLGSEHWAQLAQRKSMAYKLAQLLARDGPHHRQDYDEFELHMLLAVRELSARDHERLVGRIEQSWPAPGAKLAIGAAAQCVRWFDLIGRSDLADAHRDDVRAILERHWVSRGEYPSLLGGFTSLPRMTAISHDEPTLLGVELMARFGVPGSIDLRMLREYLRNQSLWNGPLINSPGYLAATERASLLRVDAQLGLPKPSVLNRLVAMRLAIATLLIVALSLLSVHRARPLDEALVLASGGAQP